MLLSDPLIVIVPDECVNVPEPEVERLPLIDKDEDVAATDEEDIVRLLKLYVPLPLIVVEDPFIFTVPVAPLNIP
jgi:hypothetical protein